MELKTSVTGIPYIHFNDRNRIAFCRSTATKEGYQHLIIKADIIETAVIKKTLTKVPTQTMFMIDIDLKGLPNIINRTNPHMKRKTFSKISKLIDKYLVGGIMPFNKIENLRKDLENLEKK